MKKTYYSTRDVTNNNERFFELKNRLESLNYKIPFEIGSAKLIEALVNDITQYLLELKSLKQEKKEFSSNNGNKDLALAAIKHENNRLIKENNELHREIIETKKRINFSGNAKEIEIKRLTDEKNDLRFMNTTLKNKAAKHEAEANNLRKKLYKILIHIYETNMNENTLRKMFEKDFNIKLFEQLIEHKEPIELDIYVHKREIAISSTIESNDFFRLESHENNKIDEETIKQGYLSNAIKKTFGDSIQKGGFSPIQSRENFHKDGNDFFKISGAVKDTKNNDELKLEIEKLKVDLIEKEKEINKLNRLCKDENSNEKEIIINYLKDDLQMKSDSSESKINYLLKENKILQKLNNQFSDRIRNYERQCPYLLEVEKKLDTFIGKNAKLEKENLKTSSELELCREELKKYKAEAADRNLKMVPKEMLSTYEESYSKLHESLNSAHEVIKILDEKHKNEASANSSNKSVMLCQVRNLNLEIKTKELEKRELEDKLDQMNFEKEESSEKINNLNVHLIQKDNTINELKLLIDNLTSKFISSEKAKNSIIQKTTELEENVRSLKNQLKLKDTDIDRLSNMKDILEKQLQMHEINLMNQSK